MKYYFFAIAAVAFILQSCSTDVELNAPYKSTTVVFGLLNPDSDGNGVFNALDTQWVKINKTFLGEGDNTVYAGIRDSSEYSDDDFEYKVVEQMDENDVVHTYELHSIEVSNKSVDGIFYGPEQTLYYFIPQNTGLNQNFDYRINLKFKDGNEVTATTNLVNYSGFSFLSPQNGSSIALATLNSNGGVNYVDPVSIRWYSGSNAALYSAVLRFHYTELIYDNTAWTGTPVSSTPKYIDYKIGDLKNEDLEPGSMLILEFSGQGFYNFVNNSIDVNPYARRIMGFYDVDDSKTKCFDVLLTIGNTELANYIEVNTPSGSIIQERPVYTNINNGLGLFASRGQRRVLNLPLTGVDQNGLPVVGNLYGFFTAGGTANLNFCDPNGSSDFACDF